MAKIKKGDRVLAIAGNEKGRHGQVLSVKGDRVIAQGLNVRKKCVKAQRNQAGQILEIEAPIHISNLKLCDADGKALKVKVRLNENNEREYVTQDGEKTHVYRRVK